MEARSGAGSGRRRPDPAPLRARRGVGQTNAVRIWRFGTSLPRALRSLSSEGHEELVGVDILHNDRVARIELYEKLMENP